jgi:hypothetical protein
MISSSLFCCKVSDGEKGLKLSTPIVIFFLNVAVGKQLGESIIDQHILKM